MSNLRENAFSVYFLCFYLYNPMILRYSVNEEKSGLQVRGKIVGKRSRAFESPRLHRLDRCLQEGKLPLSNKMYAPCRLSAQSVPISEIVVCCEKSPVLSLAQRLERDAASHNALLSAKFSVASPLIYCSRLLYPSYTTPQI